MKTLRRKREGSETPVFNKDSKVKLTVESVSRAFSDIPSNKDFARTTFVKSDIKFTSCQIPRPVSAIQPNGQAINNTLNYLKMHEELKLKSIIFLIIF
jgi:hypothetical protein